MNRLLGHEMFRGLRLIVVFAGRQIRGVVDDAFYRAACRGVRGLGLAPCRVRCSYRILRHGCAVYVNFAKASGTLTRRKVS